MDYLCFRHSVNEKNVQYRGLLASYSCYIRMNLTISVLFKSVLREATSPLCLVSSSFWVATQLLVSTEIPRSGTDR